MSANKRIEVGPTAKLTLELIPDWDLELRSPEPAELDGNQVRVRLEGTARYIPNGTPCRLFWESGSDSVEHGEKVKIEYDGGPERSSERRQFALDLSMDVFEGRLFGAMDFTLRLEPELREATKIADRSKVRVWLPSMCQLLTITFPEDEVLQLGSTLVFEVTKEGPFADRPVAVAVSESSVKDEDPFVRDFVPEHLWMEDQPYLSLGWSYSEAGPRTYRLGLGLDSAPMARRPSKGAWDVYYRLLVGDPDDKWVVTRKRHLATVRRPKMARLQVTPESNRVRVDAELAHMSGGQKVQVDLWRQSEDGGASAVASKIVAFKDGRLRTAFHLGDEAGEGTYFCTLALPDGTYPPEAGPSDVIDYEVG